jgi:hypothetical protein
MIPNSKGSQCFAERLSPTIGRRTRRQLPLFSDGNQNNINRRKHGRKPFSRTVAYFWGLPQITIEILKIICVYQRHLRTHFFLLYLLWRR